VGEGSYIEDWKPHGHKPDRRLALVFERNGLEKGWQRDFPFWETDYLRKLNLKELNNIIEKA